VCRGTKRQELQVYHWLNEVEVEETEYLQRISKRRTQPGDAIVDKNVWLIIMKKYNSNNDDILMMMTN
jgi:hypothetical protein